MKEKSGYYIVKQDVLPEVFIKVVEAKRLLESEKVQTVQEAVELVGISRSSFYKYKDSVFPFFENSRGRTITISIQLEDQAGLLSHVLNVIASVGANILTIHQTIPVNKIANVTITMETNPMKDDIKELMDQLESIEGVLNVKIIARE
ncbi:ACT domain-containing protein [Defluviitalea raffinosedens]|uniref:ACT domain-containing protein n=1 Tax=Defluviitalea raffinosedens TaxID=1450156 RepID=UPI00195A8627|nr:ACT domain-containing protein [Defluviitalea raffinosedens]MBM7686485.1 chorismate mutase [Defluviitalea raffinosedens]